MRAEIAKEELGEYVERYKTMMYEMTTGMYGGWLVNYSGLLCYRVCVMVSEELKEECQAFCVEY